MAEEVADWMTYLLQVQYKPGYRFELIEEDSSGAHVHVITPPMTDSRHPENQASFVQEYDLPVFDAATADADFKKNVLKPYEEHELDEWFVVAGERVSDPHDGVPLPRCYVAPEDLPVPENAVQHADDVE